MVDFQRYREVSFQEMLKTGGGAQGGLTVRDYFAAKAMVGVFELNNIQQERGESMAETIARLSYRMADAMMKERNRQDPKPAPTVEEAFKL